VGDGDTKADEESRGDEHSEVDTDALENDTQNPDWRSETLSLRHLWARITHMMIHPIMIPARRPRISAVYGTTGSAASEPTLMIQLKRPSKEPVGWSKSKCKCQYHWLLSLSL